MLAIYQSVKSWEDGDDGVSNHVAAGIISKAFAIDLAVSAKVDTLPCAQMVLLDFVGDFWRPIPRIVLEGASHLHCECGGRFQYLFAKLIRSGLPVAIIDESPQLQSMD